MKILSAKQIRAVDAYTIQHEPVASVDLMERAALACVRWITLRFNVQRKIIVFAGPGNNGGDGLAIARHLLQMNYDVSIYLLTDPEQFSEDTRTNYQRLDRQGIKILTKENLPPVPPSALVIDALFGTGLSRPLEGAALKAVTHINNSGATVISIDIPSGLFCEDNEDNHKDAMVRAKYTLSFQQPKLSFFFAENILFVGEWQVLDIGLLPEAMDRQSSNNYALLSNDIAAWVQPRNKFSHKGDFGHACIIAGSHGMMGAAVLAVKACLHTGAGLVTAHIPQKENIIMQVSVPEALASSDPYPFAISQIPDLGNYSAIGIGPGIGKKQETQQALLALLNMFASRRLGLSARLVLDADALNILSENKDWLNLLPANCILTPHPKEFDRLAGASGSGYQRYLRQMEFARKYAVFVVLKGAHTSIATPDGICFFNTTGNPGMATGGSGDVLTGIIVSLLAQGWSPCQAACAGVWLHGLAGDLAMEKSGQHSLIARDIIKNIGKAFKKVRTEG